MCAAPTAPTLASITAEAIQKAGYTATLSPQYAFVLNRSQTQWAEEVKNDIYLLSKNLKSLQTTTIILTVIGQTNYDLPTDFSGLSGDIIEILRGDTTGTAQTGAVGSITLASGASATDDFYQRKEIVTTGGTGSLQVSRIYSYNGTTKVASVAPVFSTAPDVTTTYMIVDNYYRMDKAPVWDVQAATAVSSVTRPLRFYLVEDADNGQINIDPPPDKVYAMRLRYYADLMELDLASTLMGTLYKKWRNVWLQGIYAKCLQAKSDDKYKAEMTIYGNLLTALRGLEENEIEFENLQIKLVG